MFVLYFSSFKCFKCITSFSLHRNPVHYMIPINHFKDEEMELSTVIQLIQAEQGLESSFVISVTLCKSFNLLSSIIFLIGRCIFFNIFIGA